MMKVLKICFILSCLLLLSCNSSIQEIENLKQVSSVIKQNFAPDKRVAIFDINFSKKNKTIELSGETNTKIGFQVLLDSLDAKKLSYTSAVRILPDSAVGNKIYAVGRNSVINIRSKPKHSAELGTQGLLGMSLKVLDKKGDFYRVQTPDRYISWVDKGGITRMTREEFEKWHQSKKVIYTQNFGYVYSEKNNDTKIVSDISIGGKLKYLSEDKLFYTVKYPDGREGFIKKTEATPYDLWLKNVVPNAEHIAQVAKSMDGFPYLWGGTSAKGMDCSGFTKMVYLMNGFVIPRDASQQINAGKTIDPNLTFEGLEKGDLLFFGKKATEQHKQRVTHVGIWLGNNRGEFIHASGNVHLSSIDENHPEYDAFNKNRYLGSKRYLGVQDDLIVDLKENIKP